MTSNHKRSESIRKSSSGTPDKKNAGPGAASLQEPVLHRLREEAARGGFVAIGFARPERPLFFDAFHQWLSAGKQGEMRWLERHLPIREDPEALLPGCRTIITLAYPYTSIKPATPDGYTAARYTEPRQKDYHNRLRAPARCLGRSIQASFPGSRYRVCIDSAPIMERSFACRSGIGFIGKNNMLIVPGHGSYLYLVEILTTAPLAIPEVEPVQNLCGDCMRCVEACPTGALEKPFSIDARKCLSYLTIEWRGDVSGKAANEMGNCFFGCDRCQEACPFNGDAHQRGVLLPSSDEILGMGDVDFSRDLGQTCFGRAGLGKVKQNLRAVKRGAGSA